MKLCEGVNGECAECGQPLCEGSRRVCKPWMKDYVLPVVARVSQPLGLGDYTERLFKTIGITPERYIEAKALFGLAPTCGCAGRKEWLNKVGAWFKSPPPPAPPQQ